MHSTSGRPLSLKESTDPAVVCRATPPFTVVYANPAWEALCGFTSAEMMGRSLRCLQGPATDQNAVNQLMQSVGRGEACVIPSLINYDKQGRAFAHTVSVAPLSASDSGGPRYFRATSIVVNPLHAETACNSAMTSVDASTVVCNYMGLGTMDTTSAELETTLGSSMLDCEAALGCGCEQALLPSLMPVPRPLSCGLAPPQMVVLTSAAPPYGILWASPPWLALCGFTLPEIMGSDLRCIQGPATDRVKIAQLMACVKRKQRSTHTGLVNYDKHKRPFIHTLSVFPVAGDLNSERDAPIGRAAAEPNARDISMFRAESTDVRVSCGGIFAPFQDSINGLVDEPPEEEDNCWGDDMEDILYRVDRMAQHVEFSSRSQSMRC